MTQLRPDDFWYALPGLRLRSGQPAAPDLVGTIGPNPYGAVPRMVADPYARTVYPYAVNEQGEPELDHSGQPVRLDKPIVETIAFPDEEDDGDSIIVPDREFAVGAARMRHAAHHAVDREAAIGQERMRLAARERAMAEQKQWAQEARERARNPWHPDRQRLEAMYPGRRFNWSAPAEDQGPGFWASLGDTAEKTADYVINTVGPFVRYTSNSLAGGLPDGLLAATDTKLGLYGNYSAELRRQKKLTDDTLKHEGVRVLDGTTRSILNGATHGLWDHARTYSYYGDAYEEKAANRDRTIKSFQNDYPKTSEISTLLGNEGRKLILSKLPYGLVAGPGADVLTKFIAEYVKSKGTRQQKWEQAVSSTGAYVEEEAPSWLHNALEREMNNKNHPRGGGERDKVRRIRR